jgi:hypothetical protein
MMMGSKRGSVREVLSLNYDDILEWYLELHGYLVQVVCTHPALQSNADVVVYHPHGYIPKLTRGQASKAIILSELSYNKRMGAVVEPFKDMTRNMFTKAACLFVGLSGDDPEWAALLADAAAALNDSRPIGFWLMGPDMKKDDDWFMRRGVVPVRFETFDKIPWFLLDICQAAGSEMAKAVAG